MFLIKKPQKQDPKKPVVSSNPVEAITTETVKGLGQVVSAPLDMKAWMGDMVTLPPEELAKKKKQDDANKEKEMAQLKDKIAGQGRNVDQEIKQVVSEKERAEKEKEEQFLQQLQMKRQQEQAEMAAQVEISTPAGKQKKKRGSAMAPGKVSKPSQEQMSNTGEFTQKPE